ELFGFLRKPVPRGAYAVLVRLLTGSPDIHAALESTARFYGIFDAHRYLLLSVDGTRATLSVHPRDADQARSIFFVHGFLLTPWRTAAWLAGRYVALEEVLLPRRFRRFVGETRYLFGREPRFADAAPRICFDAELLRLPVVRRPDEADSYARASLRTMLLSPPPPSLHADLRAVLAAASPVADLSIEEAARRLALSRASLARKLARHGTSFRRVKDELRRDSAIALLTESSLGLTEIAARLGYSAASAFQRAFRDWTGMPAGGFRRRRGASWGARSGTNFENFVHKRAARAPPSRPPRHGARNT